MKARIAVVAFLLSFMLQAIAQSPSARDELNEGVQAYKQGKYEDAIRYFQKSVDLDPKLVNAHLYLATALAQQYIPGLDWPDNTQKANAAIAEYQKVLDIDAKSVNSVKGIAYLDLQMKRFVESKKYYRRAIEICPQNPEAYYSIGVIDWTESYQRRMDLRQSLRLEPEQTLMAVSQCWELRIANEEVVKEGMDMLTQALTLRPDYDDAMAYMNLLYRERADIQCSDPTANNADLKAADKWVDLTMETKKAKVEKRLPGSQSLPQNQP
jgi:tetratricopeptide (TPR) repeat protein